MKAPVPPRPSVQHSARLRQLRDTQAAARALLEGRTRNAMQALRRRMTSNIQRSPALAELTAARTRRRQRNLVVAGIAAAILLALLLRACPQEEASIDIEVPLCPVPPECPTGPEKQRRGVPRKIVRAAQTEATSRDRFAVESLPPPAWLAEFRMQVTARSRELARCFAGADKPGALRLTTTVNARLGTLADSSLEPVLRAPAPTSTQTGCVLRELSARPFRLPATAADDIGARISLVLEF